MAIRAKKIILAIFVWKRFPFQVAKLIDKLLPLLFPDQKKKEILNFPLKPAIKLRYNLKLDLKNQGDPKIQFINFPDICPPKNSF